MSKVLGYIVGGLFVLGFLAPIPIAGWLVYDRVSVYRDAVLVPAVIEECRSVRVRGNTRASFVAVARTNAGDVVQGEFGWSKRRYCESDIGDQIHVLMNQKESGDSRLFTFWEFWFIPLALCTVVCVLYPMGIRAKRRKDELAD